MEKMKTMKLIGMIFVVLALLHTANAVEDLTGTCCLDLSCIESIPLSLCDALVGTFMGEGIPCEPNPCGDIPVGACCIEDSCIDTDEEDCSLSGGAFMGEGTFCEPETCGLPPETGACCVEYDCFDVINFDCDMMVGAFMGEGTFCEPETCGLPPECFMDSDCSGYNPSDPCSEICEAEVCIPAPPGTPCDTGNECIEAELCDGIGSCDGGVPLPYGASCGDFDVECHENDFCDGGGSCLDAGYEEEGMFCDSGDECTVEDSCDASGNCISGIFDCEPEADPCTNGVLDVPYESDIDCGGISFCAPCDIGLMCTIDNECVTGYCDETRHCAVDIRAPLGVGLTFLVNQPGGYLVRQAGIIDETPQIGYDSYISNFDGSQMYVLIHSDLVIPDTFFDLSSFEADDSITPNGEYVSAVVGDGPLSGGIKDFLVRVGTAKYAYCCPNDFLVSGVTPICQDMFMTTRTILVNEIPYFACYGTVGTGAATNGETDLIINDSAEGSSVAQSAPVDFYAHYYNLTDGTPLTDTNSNCDVIIEGSTYNMIYDIANSRWNYSYSGYGSNGVKWWTASCNTTLVGHFNLTSTDSITVAGQGTTKSALNITNMDGVVIEGNIIQGNLADAISIHGLNNSNIDNNDIINNLGYGIYLDSSFNNNLANNNLTNNTLWDFYSTNALFNTVINLTTNNSLSSFDYAGDIRFKSASAPAADGSHMFNVGRYLNIENLTNAWVELNMSYGSSTPPTTEGDMFLFRYTGSVWDVLPGSVVEPTLNYVSVNISEFSIFAPMEFNNSVPIVSVDMTPNLPVTINNLVLNGSCADADDNPITLYWRVWNGTNVYSSGLNSSYIPSTNMILETVLSSQIIVGQTWTGQVWCDDGFGNTADVNDSVTIQDSIAIITSFSVNDTNHNIVANYSASVSDDDGLSVCFIEHNNSGLFANTTPVQTLSSTTDLCEFNIQNNAINGITIGWYVWVNDSAGTWYRSALRTNITTNTLPTLTIITPNATNLSYGDPVLVTTVDASDYNIDDLKLECGFSNGAIDACISSYGAVQRNCTITWPYSDNSNHTIYCRTNDSYGVSTPDVEYNLTSNSLVKRCMNITNDNLTYTLVNNLTDTQFGYDRCIYINATNVTLDCNGYNITKVSSGDYGVAVEYSENVTIKNCRIKHYVEDAINVYMSNSTIIKDNVLLNLTDGAIEVRDSNGTVIDNNVINDTGSECILIEGTSHIVIKNNNISFCDNDHGISLQWYGTNITIFNNIISYVGEHAINAEALTTNISNNILSYSENYGIYLSESDNSTIQNNLIEHSGEYGIYLESFVDNVTFIDNTVINSTVWDFYSEDSSNDNNAVIDLITGNTTSSFTYGGGLALRDSIANVTLPSGYDDMIHYLNITNLSADTWMYLTISYTQLEFLDSDIGEEDSIRIWKYNGSWVEELGTPVNNVDEVQDFAYANISEFGSIFAILGELEEPDTGGRTGGGGGSGGLRPNITVIEKIPKQGFFVYMDNLFSNVKYEFPESWPTELRVDSMIYGTSINDQIFEVDTKDTTPLTAPTGNVYKYFEFDTDEFNGTITGVDYDFRVMIDWLESTGTDVNKMKLYGHDGVTWQELDSEVDISNGTYIYYLADDSDLFEVIAIAESGAEFEELSFLSVIYTIEKYYRDEVEFIDVIKVISDYYNEFL